MCLIIWGGIIGAIIVAASFAFVKRPKNKWLRLLWLLPFGGIPLSVFMLIDFAISISDGVMTWQTAMTVMAAIWIVLAACFLATDGVRRREEKADGVAERRAYLRRFEK